SMPPPRPEDLRQLEVYLALLRMTEPDRPLRGELVEVYAASRRQRVTPVETPDVAAWIERAVLPWVRWVEIVLDHRERRRGLDIEFPHDTPRLVQKEIASAVCDACESGVPLLLSAPTGSGKTAP